ncbi:LysR family transcriptional regulator [Aquimarina addita]|uniref:LysR family transcriptional regulator n=1 Tax=Aquimarina addita TaxID=870485 RepID=A0ABP6UV02_9FLAO
MHYTLHQLHIFLKIAEKQSITKASIELHLTQPAVSIQLKNFQDQFPIPLTEVIGRKLYVTDFGKEIAIAAEKILEEVKQINYKTLAYQGELSGVLKISVVSTGKYIMPYFLSDFIKQNSGVNLILDVTNKAKVIDSLEKNTVDFSLVSVLPDKLQIEKTKLMENQLYLVGNSDQKFTKKIYNKSIFTELPLIYREQGSGTRYTMEKFIEKNNIPVSKKMELTSNEAVKQAVIAGLGYSIMPLIGIRNELKTGRLQIIPVEGFPIKSNWNMIWLKNKKFSLVANAFLEYLEEEKNTIIKQKFDIL